MPIVLSAAECIADSAQIIDPVIFIEDDRIARIATRSEVEFRRNAQHFNFPGATLLPSFLDVHFHGSAGCDVMQASPDELTAIARFLASRGVAGYLPTTMTAPIDQTLASIDNLAIAIEHENQPGSARPLGLHLEGPFISHKKRGVHPPEHIQEPSISLFDRFWQASRGHIKLITIAPEIPGAIDLIRHCSSLGVVVSLGHSDADTQQTLLAAFSGALSFTHTFNAMRPIDHRDPGIAVAALGALHASMPMYSELICDGIHVHPAMVRLWHAAKLKDRALLITDAISATGMPDGNYTLAGLTVQVAEGRCTRDGVLAGSVLTMDRAVENLRMFTDAPASELALASSTNAARMIGVSHDHGELATGRLADIAVVSAEGRLIASFLSGRRAT